MSDWCLVEFSHGGSYAPCCYTYRIVSERLHRRAMSAVVLNGGPVPEDEFGRDDNVLLQGDLDGFGLSARQMRDLDEWGSVRVRMDRYEAFSYYGWDAAEVSA